MRVGIRRFARGAAAMAMLAFAACASSGAAMDTPAPSTPGSGAAASTSLAITVMNEHGAAQHFVLFIEPSAGGIRQSLGEVEIGVSKNFNFTGPFGQYVLVAQTPNGNVNSSRFTHSGTNRITWDRSTGRIITNNR